MQTNQSLMELVRCYNLAVATKQNKPGSMEELIALEKFASELMSADVATRFAFHELGNGSVKPETPIHKT